jgi:hypothetical protein
MKNVLIITSHYPPSNLAGVHRGRLFAKYLPQFGWNPIVLTVHENYYEEKLDTDLSKLIPSDQQVERVNAFPISKPRLVGDLGLRAFFQLRKRANQIIKEKKIDFIYIIIPSFYLTLLGPYLRKKHGIKIGIDYMDPWVHFFPGSEQIFSRHWWSTKISKYLESYVLKYTSLITSVAPNYIQPLFARNCYLKESVKTLSVPCGWDMDEKFQLQTKYKTDNTCTNRKRFKLIYAGAFLPKSDPILNDFLLCIKKNIEYFQDVEIHFIGTGLTNNTKGRISISEQAASLNLLNNVIFEKPERIFYFDLLHQISQSSGVFILGSTESHYTPSKLFNAFVTQKPIFAILNSDSTAKDIIGDTGWGLTCIYPGTDKSHFENNVIKKFSEWKYKVNEENWEFDHEKAFIYSANNITSQLASVIDDTVR